MKHDVKPEIEKTEEQWRADLGPERYQILREAGTERAFTGDLLDEHSAGTFVCGACGSRIIAWACSVPKCAANAATRTWVTCSRTVPVPREPAIASIRCR